MLKEILESKMITLIFKNEKDMDKVYDMLLDEGMRDDEVENLENDYYGFYYFEIPIKYIKKVIEIRKKISLYICK